MLHFFSKASLSHTSCLCMFQHWNHQLPLLVTFLATQLLHSRPFHSIITVKKTRPFGFKSKGRRSLPPADSRLFKIMSRTMTMHLIVHLKEYAYTPLTYHMMAISTFIGERIESNNNAVNPFFRRSSSLKSLQGSLEHLVDTGQAFGSNCWQEQWYLSPRGYDVFQRCPVAIDTSSGASSGRSISPRGFRAGENLWRCAELTASSSD